jgi:hypothetical protein
MFLVLGVVGRTPLQGSGSMAADELIHSPMGGSRGRFISTAGRGKKTILVDAFRKLWTVT